MGRSDLYKLASLFSKLAARKHLELGQLKAAKEAIRDAEPDLRRWFKGLVEGKVAPRPGRMITESIAEIKRIHPGGKTTIEAIPVHFDVAGTAGEAAAYYNPREEIISVQVDPKWAMVYGMMSAVTSQFGYGSAPVRGAMGDPFDHIRGQLYKALSSAVHEFTHAGQVQGPGKERKAHAAGVYRNVAEDLIRPIAEVMALAEKGERPPVPAWEREQFLEGYKNHLQRVWREFRQQDPNAGRNIQYALSLIGNIRPLLINGNMTQIVRLYANFRGRYFNTPAEVEAYLAQMVTEFEENLDRYAFFVLQDFMAGSPQNMVVHIIEEMPISEFFLMGNQKTRERMVNVLLGAIARNTKRIQQIVERAIAREPKLDLEEEKAKYPQFFESTNLADVHEPIVPREPMPKAASHISAF